MNELSRIQAPWAMTAKEVTLALDVDPVCGLDHDDVLKRQELFGENVLQTQKPRSTLSIFVAQFKSFLVALLAIAAAASMYFGHWVEAGAIVVVIVINGALGFIIELRATRSVEALRSLGTSRATVRRASHLASLPAQELVPGDIVLLEGGDVVTADLRLLSASKVKVDESTFTGESLPIKKQPEPQDQNARLADRASMLFKGTAITRGAAEAVVVTTGMATELGAISKLVSDAADESTPLEQRLNKLGQGFVWITLALCGVVLGSGLLIGTELVLLVQTIIALAVATVPEGLPVIATIALARGVHRMAQHQALVRRLSAVETLGATSVLCTDKTGTLTENRMTVREVRTVDGGVWNPDEDGFKNAKSALRIGALCNNASLENGEIIGDPMEGALLVAAEGAGLDQAALLSDAPEVREVAFDSVSKMMATVHVAGNAFEFAIKGAPEAVLEACDLDDGDRATWQKTAEQMAQRGLRVLAFARKLDADKDKEAYTDLELVGFAGMMDPPRKDVVEVVRGCHAAGMRIVMVTGDHPGTALVIANETGLAKEGARTALGASLASDDADLDVEVFARVSPEEKLTLIRKHQAAGAIVAMTGDGVNDAPALKQADIGVAMGGRGTEVARQAADLVLKDDQLGTLLLAIREGRVIFDNLRNFVIYLLSCNVAEVLIVGLAAVFGAPFPLLPLQILFLNLVTDVFPALALGVGEGRDDVMTRPPRHKSQQILGRPQWTAVVVHGTVFTTSVLAVFFIALSVLKLPIAEAQTVTFLGLGLGQTLHVLNLRAARTTPWNNDVVRNRWAWGAMLLSAALMLLTVFVPPVASVLQIAPLSSEGWLLTLAASSAPLVVGQVLLSLGVIDHARDKPMKK